MNKTDNKFIQENLGLVHSLAARFKGRGIEYEELFAAGCEGLVKAGIGFDESRGLKFSTYAVPVILGEIKRLFRDGGAVKVSRSLKELSLKVTAVQAELRSRGNEPKLSEIADVLGITVEQAGEAVSASLPPLSLTAESEEENERELDVPVPPEQTALTDRIALNQCLLLLEDEERQIIVLRYLKNLTQTDVGKITGMSQVQVSRKEKKALKRLRELLEG